MQLPDDAISISGTGPEPELPDVPCKVSDFGLHGVPDLYQRNDFWDACQPWLAKRGIRLYEQRLKEPERHSEPRFWASPPSSNAASLPYGALLDEKGQQGHRSRFFSSGSRLAYAQDTMHRDVVLKLVDNGSEEHEIYELILQDASMFASNVTFPCVLPALAILSTPYQYSFVVMPMWGSPLHLEDVDTVQEVLRFMECSLRGLRYLHHRRIARRDICDDNIVINSYSPRISGQEFVDGLREHRRRSETFYALMDYDQSLRLPRDVCLKECRRPAPETAFGANPFKPRDIDLGQPYYNPFAYDVAAMGLLFRYYFAEAVTVLPGLAALFDRMTDHSISRRLTAEEALAFLDDLTQTVAPEMLEMHVVLKASYDSMNSTDTYWNKLSRDELFLWDKYRTPPRSLLVRALDWITDHPMGWMVMCFVRRVLQM
ncbi:hypothetical protein BV20DRAFT_975793 [Pilatotrama ljubarskyi]|nr:hypothetical protein BV20DRAFT_975793 [Pilatotrama ljubarskyi]